MSKERIGLVLSGGGARGAYEAGAISTLLPALARRGERPRLFVGTSVGAINAAYLAGSAHLDVEEVAAGTLARWEEATMGAVIRPVLLRQAPLNAIRYAGELLGLPGVRLPSLLDPRPLERSLSRWINWDAIHRNVSEGRVDSLAVMATGARSGRSVAFVEAPAGEGLHRSHVIEYVPARVGPEHVRASAAIPVLFPPVHVTDPAEARGWYVDGGTRLNTPIKPALDLGVDRLIAIATESVAEPPEPLRPDDAGEPPDFGLGALQVLQGALADPLVEDMRLLGNVNLFYADSRQAPGARRYREVRGKGPYREVPYVLVAPRRRGAIGTLAGEVFRARYGGLKGLRSPDLPLPGRLLGRESAGHGELLSYLLFDREFLIELMRMGEEDARAWLEAPPDQDGPWRLGPLEAFTRRGDPGKTDDRDRV